MRSCDNANNNARNAISILQLHRTGSAWWILREVTRHAHKITIKFRYGLKNDFCLRAVRIQRATHSAAKHKHNIRRNYDSMFKSTLVYLYASMSNQYYTYIFTSEFTSKPPISRQAHIHIPARNRYRGVSQVLIFVLCSFICFSLFTEKSVDLRGAGVSIASTLPRARVSGYARFHSFIYRTEISLISIVRTALMRCLVIHRF